jgi:hypothetical protein
MILAVALLSVALAVGLPATAWVSYIRAGRHWYWRGYDKRSAEMQQWPSPARRGDER